MKLSNYAKLQGVTYRTAYRWFKAGSLNAVQMTSGAIIVDHKVNLPKLNTDVKVIVYARVSSSQNKDTLDSQANRLELYASAKGYQIVDVIKEIGSGLNDKRPKLLTALSKTNFDVLLVEHSDRLARFGVPYISSLLDLTNRKLEIVNLTDGDEADLIQDFVSIITSYCSKIYGRRRSKRNTEKLIAELNK